MGRQERAAELIALIERHGLQFKLASDLIVVVTTSEIPPTEVRGLVEKLGHDDGSPEQPGISGVLFPYLRSELRMGRGTLVDDFDARNKLGFSHEYGWGTVVDRDGDGAVLFAPAGGRMRLRLPLEDLVVVVSREEITPVLAASEAATAPAAPSGLKRFLNFLR